MSKIKQLVGDTVLYGLGSMVPRMLNFLLLPLHTRDVFSPEEYSVNVKLYALVGFVNVVYMFGMETAFFRFASKPGADQKRIFDLAQTIVIGISVFLSASFILFAPSIAQSLGVSDHPEFIIWLTLVMLIDAIVAIPFAQLRLERKPLKFVTGKIINIVLLLGLNIYFLKIDFKPAIGIGLIFLANLIANSFYILFFLKKLLAWRPAFDGSISKAMFLYAYPVMITGVAGMINEMFSRYTLEWWLPEGFYPGKSEEHAVGVFGACYKFAVLMNLAVQAFRFAAEPFFFSNAADKNSPALFAQINHYFVISCCLLLLGVGINLDLLKFLIGPEYYEGLPIVPILLMAYLFLGVYYNMTVWFKLTDKTYYGTLITIIGAIVTIGGNYVLIPMAGYFGSSFAALLCYFVMTVICYGLGQKYFPVPYRVSKGLLYILATFTLVYAVNAILFPSQWVATVLKALIIILWVVGAFFIEKKELKTFLR